MIFDHKLNSINFEVVVCIAIFWKGRIHKPLSDLVEAVDNIRHFWRSDVDVFARCYLKRILTPSLACHFINCSKVGIGSITCNQYDNIFSLLPDGNKTVPDWEPQKVEILALSLELEKDLILCFEKIKKMSLLHVSFNMV